MLDVAVVGVGTIGAALAATWQRAGLEVALVGRDLETSTMIRVAATLGLRRWYLDEALLTSRAVVIADPIEPVPELFSALGRITPSAVVFDATEIERNGITHVAAIRSAVPRAAVYRAFTTTGWANAVPTAGAVPAGPAAGDLLYAGPDDVGRDIVEGLTARVGFRPVYVGGYDRIELVDSLARRRLDMLGRSAAR